MKIKEFERTANIAWSPKQQYPVYMAAATAAQQLDATFSTTASVDLYKVDLTDPSLSMPIVASLNTESRYHKLVWGSSGMDSSSPGAGQIIGGADNGQIYIWDAAKVISGQTKTYTTCLSQHTGSVAALDINPYQPNLLASGAGDSEIFIWDLNTPEKPMNPGTKSQPPDDVNCIAWNHQVQHILASTYAGRCIVWDLRKNQPIIKVTDSLSRIKGKWVAWHPEVATQLCLASEDDHSPHIQLWDLRFATSPLKSFESHTKGVLSIAWCAQDSNLLLSCGKDNRMICWNPSSDEPGGEVVNELPICDQWSFDVQWSPRICGVAATSSFSGKVSLFNLNSGKSDDGEILTEYDSFGRPKQVERSSGGCTFKYPPKWLVSPCRPSFGFGGKLIYADKNKVNICQVVTEEEFVSRSNQLQQSLRDLQYIEYSSGKSTSSTNKRDRDIWTFIEAHFSDDPNSKFKQLLGFTSIENQFSNSMNLAHESPSDDEIFEPQNGRRLSFSSENPKEVSIIASLVMCDYTEAVRLCLRENKMAEALVLSVAAARQSNELLDVGPLFTSTQTAFFESQALDPLSQVIEAVISGDLEKVARTCNIEDWKHCLALTLSFTSRGHGHLTPITDILADRLEKNGDQVSACLCYIVAGSLSNLITCLKRTVNAPKLQDLVEIIMIMERACLVRNLNTDYKTDTIVTSILTEYSARLCNQGCLEAAHNYLQSINDNMLSILAERISISLGKKRSTTNNNNTMNRRTNQNAPSRQVEYSRSLSSSSGTVYPVASSTSRPYNSYAPPLSTYPSSGGFSTAPSSTGYTLGNRPSYRDCNPSSSYQNSTPTPTPNSMYAAAPTSYPSTGGYDSAPNTTGFTPTVTAQPFYPPTGGSSFSDSTSNYGDDTAAHSDVTKERLPAHMRNVGAWNDPPLLKSKKEVVFSAPAAITQPIFNPNQPAPGYQQSSMISPGIPTNTPLSSTHSQPTVNYNVKQAEIAAPPPPPQEKPAIPAQHLIIEQVFNSMITQCHLKSSQTQFKRKIDDISKKCELLYDKLRFQLLSENILEGLLHMAAYIREHDYQNALALNTQMISQGNFSEICTFMPAIKTLVQTAWQSNIYI